jgi:hypothetical protein
MPMPVLMIGEVPNLTEETYGAMVGQLMPPMRATQGFISHAGGPLQSSRDGGPGHGLRASLPLVGFDWAVQGTWPSPLGAPHGSAQHRHEDDEVPLGAT